MAAMPKVSDVVKYRAGRNATGNVTAIATGMGGYATVQETSPGSAVLKLDRLLLFIKAA